LAVFVAGCVAASSSPPRVDETPILTSGDKAFALLKQQVAFGPRYPGSEGHRKCLDWIVAEAGKYTDKVERQPFSHTWSANGFDVKMTNVIATMNVGAKKTVLLMAHWDTRPTADQEWESRDAKKPILGANDGASGVAVSCRGAASPGDGSALRKRMPLSVGLTIEDDFGMLPGVL